MAQLNLFKGPRQRGSAPPPPTETALHIALSDLLRRWAHKDWIWTHIPLGEHRTPATAAKLKRMGVQAGWADFIFLGPNQAVFLLELKRRGGRQSLPQASFEQQVTVNGFDYLCSDNYAEVVRALSERGIVRATVSA